MQVYYFWPLLIRQTIFWFARSLPENWLEPKTKPSQPSWSWSYPWFALYITKIIEWMRLDFLFPVYNFWIASISHRSVFEGRSNHSLALRLSTRSKVFFSQWRRWKEMFFFKYWQIFLSEENTANTHTHTHTNTHTHSLIAELHNNFQVRMEHTFLRNSQYGIKQVNLACL